MKILVHISSIFTCFGLTVGLSLAGAIVNAVGGRDVALAATLGAFNDRERSYGPRKELGRGPRPLLPTTPSQAADMRLNGVAVPIGFQLGNGEIATTAVGNLIRSNICR